MLTAVERGCNQQAILLERMPGDVHLSEGTRSDARVAAVDPAAADRPWSGPRRSAVIAVADHDRVDVRAERPCPRHVDAVPEGRAGGRVGGKRRFVVRLSRLQRPRKGV